MADFEGGENRNGQPETEEAGMPSAGAEAAAAVTATVSADTAVEAELVQMIGSCSVIGPDDGSAATPYCGGGDGDGNDHDHDHDHELVSKVSFGPLEGIDICFTVPSKQG